MAVFDAVGDTEFESVSSTECASLATSVSLSFESWLVAMLVGGRDCKMEKYTP